MEHRTHTPKSSIIYYISVFHLHSYLHAQTASIHCSVIQILLIHQSLNFLSSHHHLPNHSPLKNPLFLNHAHQFHNVSYPQHLIDAWLNLSSYLTAHLSCFHWLSLDVALLLIPLKTQQLKGHVRMLAPQPLGQSLQS